jgi:hypothetical protein
MPSNRSESATAEESTQDSLLVAYRHDTHKLTGHAHENASKTFEGVPINQQVPRGADADAAALSRPSGQPEQTVPTHQSRYRLSLLDGTSREETAQEELPSKVLKQLLTADESVQLHRRWLSSTVASKFNESVYYPYTSLKYHTLLVAALLDNYRAGSEFDNLLLVVDAPDTIVPHRTIYAGEQFALRITADPQSSPSAALGSRSWHSWSSVWSRLSGNPLDTNHCRYDRFLDANLRRIGSWSTALQYLEAFTRRIQ